MIGSGTSFSPDRYRDRQPPHRHQPRDQSDRPHRRCRQPDRGGAYPSSLSRKRSSACAIRSVRPLVLGVLDGHYILASKPARSTSSAPNSRDVEPGEVVVLTTAASPLQPFRSSAAALHLRASTSRGPTACQAFHGLRRAQAHRRGLRGRLAFADVVVPFNSGVLGGDGLSRKPGCPSNSALSESLCRPNLHQPADQIRHRREAEAQPQPRNSVASALSSWTTASRGTTRPRSWT